MYVPFALYDPAPLITILMAQGQLVCQVTAEAECAVEVLMELLESGAGEPHQIVHTNMANGNRLDKYAVIRVLHSFVFLFNF